MNTTSSTDQINDGSLSKAMQGKAIQSGSTGADSEQVAKALDRIRLAARLSDVSLFAKNSGLSGII